METDKEDDMEMTFHLTNGTSVVLDIEPEYAKMCVQETEEGWLWGSEGAGVKLSEVVSIVPGNTASGDPIYPDRIVDGEGDEWKHVGDGNYVPAGGDARWSSSYADIKERWGIQE